MHYNEKYRPLFDELIERTDAIIIDEFPQAEIPKEAIQHIRKSQARVAKGKTKTYVEVKALLNARFP